MEPQPVLVAGEWVGEGEPLPVIDPRDDSLVGSTWLVGREVLDRAAAAAVDGFAEMSHLPSYERASALEHVARQLEDRQEEVATLVAREAGKPIRDARAETQRAALTFRTSAEEAKRLTGEWFPLDVLPWATGRSAILRRFPIGPIAAISPFNYPLNLAAHKLAPAIAAGCTIVLKPASKDPLSALLLGELIAETELPKRAVSVLPMSRTTANLMAEDDRFRMLTFTGSSEVGWALRSQAGRKKVVLELGGNAAVLVDETADIGKAVTRILAGAFSYSGQSCISTQRVYCVRQRVEELTRQLVAGSQKLIVGDPLLETTDIGPMIADAEADRTRHWISNAVAAGAKCLTDPGEGRFVRPTILLEPGPDASVTADEVFAPVVGIYAVEDWHAGLSAINASRFGLQAGVFTRDITRAFQAFSELQVGGVLINDVPSWRIDPMPYGGVKESGVGREGPRWAIEEMTEPRLMVLSD